MNFNPIYMLHKCAAADDQFRPALNYIYFNNGFAYATDGHMLVRIKTNLLIDGITDEQIAALDNHGIHTNTFSKIYRLRDLELTCALGSDKKTGELRSRACWFRHVDAWGNDTHYTLTDFANYDGKGGSMKYPNAENVIADVVNDQTRKPFLECGIAPHYLENLAMAMGRVKNTRLQFRSNDRGIRVFDNDNNEHDDDIFGLLMPLHIG